MHPGERFLRFLDNRRQTVLIVSLFLIIVGARAVVINYAGNATPYADEWDGEAANLLEPYLKGVLTIGDLFHAHNEHVIFFTRLLTLAIFNLSGYWDVVLQMIANAILDAATVVLASLVPHAPSSDVYRAHSFRQFLSAVFELASWPAPPNLGALMALPSVLFCLRTFADRPALSDARWFNVAAFGWILTQFVAFAAGRALIPVENRYLDTLLIGLAVNMTSFFWLVGSDSARGKRKIWWSAALAAWLVIVAASLVRPAHPLPGSMDLRRQTADVQERNLRFYLATGDASYLAGAPLMDIPYPEATRLRELLDAPELRAALPPELLSRNTPSNWVEAFKRTFLAQGYIWLGAGVLLLIAFVAREAWVRQFGRSRHANSTSP
jgi:hypothetical protein